MRIAWKLKTLNPRVASVRYRCLLPMQALAALGHRSVVLEGKEELADFASLDGLIFVKSFSQHDAALARRARRHGLAVYLDLCDDIFVADYRGAKKDDAAASFGEMAGLASAMVTTGPVLAQRIAEQAPGTPVVVIPDPLETPADTQSLLTWRRAPDAARTGGLAHSLWQARRRTNRTKKFIRSAAHGFRRRGSEGTSSSESANGGSLARGQRIIWFGNHGGVPYSDYGMLSLLPIAPSIVEVAAELPITLVVVSDSLKTYRQHIEPLPFPTEYRDWSPVGVFEHIRDSDLCILPNSLDRFSVAKSANRAVLALSLGVPVVATAIPSLEPLRSCLILDDWKTGIMTYLSDRERAAADVAQGQRLIGELYSPAAIAAKWSELLAARAASSL